MDPLSWFTIANKAHEFRTGEKNFGFGGGSKSSKSEQTEVSVTEPSPAPKPSSDLADGDKVVAEKPFPWREIIVAVIVLLIIITIGLPVVIVLAIVAKKLLAPSRSGPLSFLSPF